MKVRKVSVFLAGAMALGAVAATAATPPAPPSRTYSALRFDEDWGWLITKPPEKKDAFDAVKYARPADGWHVTFGGSFRLRMESDWNKFLKGPPVESDDIFRPRAYLNLEIGHEKDFRWYAEIRAAETESSDRSIPALYHDDPDFQNFFFEGTIASKTPHSVTIRLGRQEMLFGAQRLISPLDWSSTRRTFDGLQVIAKSKRTKTSLFVTHPVDHEPHGIDSPIDEQWFWGVYSTIKPKDGHVVDVYAIIQDDDRDKFTSEVGAVMGGLERETFGARYDYQGKNGLRAETEWGYQRGHISTDDLSAYFGSATIGWQWKDAPWRSKLTGGFDIASGDEDPSDGERETFDPMFPLGHAYFGHIDLVGRSNVTAARVQYEAWPMKGMRWESTFHRFWLNDGHDALYDASSKSIRRDPTSAAGNDVGYEIDSLISYTFKTHHTVSFEATYWWSGDFIENTGHPNDAWWVWAAYEFKF